MSKKKIILKIIFVLFLLAGVFILQPKTLVFADAEVEEETVQEVETDEIITEEPKEEVIEEEKEEITEEPKEEVIEEEKVEEINTVEPQVESQEKPQENSEITLQEESQVEPQINSQDESQEEPQKNTEAIEKIVKENAKNSQLKKTVIKNNKSAPNEIDVETPEEFNAVITDLNNNGGSKTIKLKNDIDIARQFSLTNGILTILGENHKITGFLLLSNTAKLFLGQEKYTKTLQFDSNLNSECVLNLTGQSELYMYDGVTIGPSISGGTAGGIQLNGQSHFYMYGGIIKNCESALSVAGGVFVANSSIFDMYGGTITNCQGLQGGGVGVGGGQPIGGTAAGIATFNMYGGTISNCTDKYVGGGAICSFTSYPVIINISGGKIENCNSTSYGYGGAITLYTTSDTTFTMTGGEIIGNTAEGYGYGGGILIYARGNNTNIQLIKGTIKNNTANYGGGIFVFAGNVTIANGFSLYDNTAFKGGDDIYSNGTNIILGTVDTSATLDSCGHKIDGWYEDAENRWSYEECTGKKDYYVLFEHTGELYTEEYGLKAAHGEPIIELDEPDKPDKPDEPIIPDEPDEPIIPTEPDKPEKPTIIIKPEEEPTKPTLTPKPTNKPQFTLTIQNPIVITDTPKLTAEYSETNTIPDPETPMAAPEEKHWALLNLILSILTVIFGLIFVLYRKDDDLKVENKRKVNMAKIIAALIAIASVIVFIFTEDMTATMTWIDKWTILIAVILIGEFVIDYYIHKKSQNNEEEKEEEELDG